MTLLEREPDCNLLGRLYVKFRSSLIARLALWELCEYKKDEGGWPYKTRTGRTCRIYAQPCNREAFLPAHPFNHANEHSSMTNYPAGNYGGHYMPPLQRNVFSPRFYADQNGQIICNHFTDARLGLRSKALRDAWVDWCGAVKVKKEIIIKPDRCYLCDGREDPRDHTPNMCPLFKGNQTAGNPREVL